MHFSCILCDACQGICVLALIIELLCYFRASSTYGPGNASFITYNGKICGVTNCCFMLLDFLSLSLFLRKSLVASLCALVQTQGNIAKWRKKEGDKVSYVDIM